MRIYFARNTGLALIMVGTLAGAGASRAVADDGALLAIEDEWRRVAAAAVGKEALSQGIVVAGDAVLALAPDGGGTLGSAPVDGGSHVLYLSRPAHRLKAGLYQAVVDSAGVSGLFHFDPAQGRVRAALRVPPGDPAAFHTPLGDDLCHGVPPGLMPFCQTFVACWAYGFYC